MTPSPQLAAHHDDLGAALTAVASDLRAGNGAQAVRTYGTTLPHAAIADLLARDATAVFTDPGAAPGVSVGHGRVLDVAGAPTTGAVGVLVIGSADRAATAAAAEAAAASLAGVPGDPFAWLLRATVRAGIAVRAEPVAPWPWSDAGERIELTSDQVRRIRLTRANRADDSGYSVAVLRRASKPITALAARRGWRPNAITVASLAIGLAAAAAFAQGSRWGLLAGALLLQVSVIVDCSDGEVARLTGRFSATGAWLDAVTDRVKEFAAYAGLAIGSGRAEVWWLAGALVVVQTVRHLSDYSFAAVHRAWDTGQVVRPLLAGAPPTATPPGPGAATAATMARRTLFLPIAERWLILSVAAVAFGPVWALGLLLVLGVLSFGYANAGRWRRTRQAPATGDVNAVVAAQLDTTGGRPLPVAVVLAATCLTGLAAAAALAFGLPRAAGVAVLLLAAALAGLRPVPGRWQWALPAVVAAAELTPWWLAGCALIPDAGAAVMAWLFTVAFHRYDLLYRAGAGARPPRWLRAATLGAPVRVGVLGATLLLAPDALAGVVAAGTLYLLATAVLLASAQWLRAQGAPR